jgi:hypothetical protein
LLVLDVLISGKKGIKFSFGQTEKFAVGLSSPSLLGNRRYFVGR